MADSITSPGLLTTVGATAGTAAVVVATATIAGVYAERKIDDYLKEYGKSETKQIDILGDLYKKYCFPLEQHSTLSTLEADDMKKQLPRFFQLHDEKKIIVPLLYKNFLPQVDSYKWLIHVQKGELGSMISEMLAYVCQYQKERGRDEKHRYSPLHLFFEELKFWLIKLSTVNIADKKNKNIVENRISYLEAIRNAGVFNNEMYFLSDKVKEPTPRQTILSVEKKMNTIRNKMILAISRRSAREHFSDLKINIESALYSSVNYLLHVFSNQPLPENFILTEIKYPTIPSYKEIRQYFFPAILSAFVSTSAYSLVFSLDDFKPEENEFEKAIEVYISEKNFLLESFITNGNEITLPEIQYKVNEVNKNKKENERKTEWFEMNEAKIYSDFANVKTIGTFLSLLEWLQKMCFFYKICDSLFELAGEGGNLLVYGKAAERVISAISSFIDVLQKTEDNLISIKTRAQDNKNFIDGHPNHESLKKDKYQRKIWQLNFAKARDEYEKLDRSLKDIRKLIKEIKAKLEEVNTREYQIKLVKQLEFFNGLVNEFCDLVVGKSEAAIEFSKISLLSNYNPKNLCNNNNNNNNNNNFPLIKISSDKKKFKPS